MDYFGSSYSVNTIPVSLIRRVDVYKGVVPVELGNDALGGAFNLITKEHFENAAGLSYSFGSFNTHRASFAGNWRNSRNGASFRLSTFYNYSDNNYKVWGDNIYVSDPQTYEVERGIKVERFHDAFASGAVKAEAGFSRKKWADQVFVGILYSGMDKEIQHGPTMEVPFGEASYHQQLLMPHFTYQKTGFLHKHVDFNFFAAFSRLERTHVDTSRNIYNWYGEITPDSRLLGGEQRRSLNTLKEEVFLKRLNLTYKLSGQHKIGYNYVLNRLERTDRDPLVTQKSGGYWAPQELAKHSMGLTLQSNYLAGRLHTSLFVKWFSFSGAVKKSETLAGETTYQTVPTSESGFGYGFAASYKLTPALMLNGSAERAIRLPDATEILGDGLSVLSSVTLRPETSLNINMGFSLKAKENTRHRTGLSGNFFYRNVDDLIQQYQYDLGAFRYINFAKVLMKGFDGKVHYRYKDIFSFHQAVSFLDPVIKSDTDELGNVNLRACLSFVECCKKGIC